MELSIKRIQFNKAYEEFVGLIVDKLFFHCKKNTIDSSVFM